MSLTLNENGTALTETIEGVTMPADYSFATVNDFVHSPETQYEDLECLCLGMASEIDRLKQALTNIREHQKIIGGDLAKQGAVFNIADKALKNK